MRTVKNMHAYIRNFMLKSVINMWYFRKTSFKQLCFKTKN